MGKEAFFVLTLTAGLFKGMEALMVGKHAEVLSDETSGEATSHRLNASFYWLVFSCAAR
jgi:hypothetical protein